jgi:hypothetical protein
MIGSRAIAFDHLGSPLVGYPYVGRWLRDQRSGEG